VSFPKSVPIVFFLFSSFHLPAAPLPAASALARLAPGLSVQAVEVGLNALQRLQADGVRVRGDILTWVFDLVHERVLFGELTAHGRNSGANRAVRFSNTPESLMSSLGAFLTADTYVGKHGLSLRLAGLEKGINDNSLARGIVIHAADYVSQPLALAGRIGRSWGCPAVRPEISRRLIETLRGGSLVMSYYPDAKWLRNSSLAAPVAPAKP
jgi:hypothetical protein